MLQCSAKHSLFLKGKRAARYWTLCSVGGSEVVYPGMLDLGIFRTSDQSGFPMRQIVFWTPWVYFVNLIFDPTVQRTFLALTRLCCRRRAKKGALWWFLIWPLRIKLLSYFNFLHMDNALLTADRAIGTSRPSVSRLEKRRVLFLVRGFGKRKPLIFRHHLWIPRLSICPECTQTHSRLICLGIKGF